MTVSQNSGPVLRRNRPPNEKRLYTRVSCKIRCIYIGGPPIYLQSILKRHPGIQAFFVRGSVSPQNRP